MFGIEWVWFLRKNVMPIYEYRCLTCSNKFDELVGMGQMDAAITCPACKGKSVERVMSVFGFASEGMSHAGNSVSSCSTCSGGNCSTCH